MSRLLIVVPLLLGACYSPDVVDCVVACTSGDTCAGGQVCGADGFCAAPDVAGTCASDQPDGGPAMAAQLHVVITGAGQVDVDPLHVTCKSDMAGADCRYPSMVGVSVTLTVTPKSHNHFTAWTEGPCTGQPCTLTIAAPESTVQAMFAPGDPPD